MRTAVVVAVLFLTGCGYVGDPLPPALKIPVPAENFRALQRASKIVVDFSQTGATTEALTLAKLGPPQIEIGAETFEAPAAAAGPVHFEVDAAKWTGQTVRVRARINNGRGRYSEWSAPVELAVVQPLDIPRGLRAESVSEGVRLTWDAGPARPGQRWAVTRSSTEGDERLEAAQAEVIDRTARLGAEYRYVVQARLGSAESEPSGVVSHTHVDNSPPAVPGGLSASATANGVELTWARSTDSDVSSYRVYRKAGDGMWQVLADAVSLPAYSDRTAEAGKLYQYSVSAVDQTGNESRRSDPVEVNRN